MDLNNKNKRAAMEMSVGTIVTIVLLMTVLILGLVLVRSIFFSATTSIEGIDRAVKDEINKLFSEDNTKKIVIIPATREIVLEKGQDSRGFGFSIRNTGSEADRFSYDIKAVETSCGLRLPEAEGFIALGRQGNNIQISAGSVMEDPVFVRFNIPDEAPPCQIRYSITVEKGTQLYGSSVGVDVKIESA